MEDFLSLLAADFAALYRAALNVSLFAPSALTVSAFARVFDAAHTEYVHYAGSTPSQPFRRDVVSAVLQLAAAYLSLPLAAAPTARSFGLFLCFFLHSTQPEDGTAPTSVRVPVEAMCAYASDVETGRVGGEERRVLLAMHNAHAWRVVPFEDTAPQIRALLNAHEEMGVPLIVPHVKTAEAPGGKVCGDEALDKRLGAYEEMRKRLGL